MTLRPIALTLALALGLLAPPLAAEAQPAGKVYYPQGRRALEATQAAARTLRVYVQSVEAREASEFDGIFEAKIRGQVGALIVLPHPTYFRERNRLSALAAKHRVPSMFEHKDFVDAGA